MKHAVLQYSGLVGLSRRRVGFDPRLRHVEFLAGEGALGQVYFRVFRFHSVSRPVTQM